MRIQPIDKQVIAQRKLINLIPIFLIIFSGAIYGAQNELIETKSKPYYEKPYIRTTTFSCGGNKITVDTICSFVRETDEHAACYAQRVNFQNPKKEFFVLNKNYQENMMNIFKATCIDSQAFEGKWIVFSTGSSALGNHCIDCERDDFFSVDGTYFGSTNSKEGKKSLRESYKVINPTLKKKILKIIDSGYPLKEIDIQLYPQEYSIKK